MALNVDKLVRRTQEHKGSERMIEIKRPITGWHEVSKDEAKRYVLFLLDHITAIPSNAKAEYINCNRLRGITVEELIG